MAKGCVTRRNADYTSGRLVCHHSAFMYEISAVACMSEHFLSRQG